MKKAYKSVIIFVVFLLILLTGCSKGADFNSKDVVVQYQYNGVDNEYNSYTEDELPADKKAVSYTIKITNNSEFKLKNVCRNHAIQGTDDESNTQIKENYVEISPNSEDASFPIYLICDKDSTDEEILQSVSSKKDVVSFYVGGTKYEVIGDWENTEDDK